MVEPSNFIEQAINEDLDSGKITAVQTRFPPEPNGYLHVGHAKSICLNFGIKEKYNGKCNLFFDDTNPSKEKTEFVEAIKKDIEWLGFSWDRVCFASDFFDVIYENAIKLIKMDKAFVCDLTAEEISATRGTLTEPGKESPNRYRTIEENLDLFERMKNGEFKDGEKCLRAKIDMASPNINLRDPVIYRILRATHHRTGDKWCIYPMYDYAHPICDFMQGVTHSVCTLEFEDHRPLYDWVGITLGFTPKPRQIEFARLNITNTVMSKRYLKKLVEENAVDGWDDPRMPTLAGLRNRGVPAAALKDFCTRIGVCKANSIVEASYLEACIRDNLNLTAERAMGLKNPLKVIIENYPDGKTEEMNFDVNPSDGKNLTRKVLFSKTVYIDSDDFSDNPPPKYFRLKPDGVVRLKGAYIIKCEKVVYENGESGKVKELVCSYYPDSHSGNDLSGIKCKGTIQWVAQENAVPCEIRDYEYLLRNEDFPGQDFNERLNYNSKHVYNGLAEKYLAHAKDGESFQLMRTGYYKKTNDNGKLVLSEIVSLKDNFNKK